MVLETNVLHLVGSFFTRVFLLLGPLSKQSKKIYMHILIYEIYAHILIHIYSHIYKFYIRKHLCPYIANYDFILMSPTLTHYYTDTIPASSPSLSVTSYSLTVRNVAPTICHHLLNCSVPINTYNGLRIVILYSLGK